VTRRLLDLVGVSLVIDLEDPGSRGDEIVSNRSLSSSAILFSCTHGYLR
jgi:hypothetical protein